MRIPNERRLAHEVPEIDMLLGGHDHLYHAELVNDVFFLKSGTDFEDFTEFKIVFDVSPEEAEKAIEKIDPSNIRNFYSKNKRLLFLCQRITISEEHIPDQTILDHIIKYTEKFN